MPIIWGSSTDCFLGKAVANWEGTTFANSNNRISDLNCQPFMNDFHGERAKKGTLNGFKRYFSSFSSFY